MYTVLEDFEFEWDEDDIKAFVQMWREGTDIRDMAIRFRRPIQEVFLLALDQATIGAIENRGPAGIFANTRFHEEDDTRPNSRISERDLHMMRRLYEAGVSQTRIAVQFGISQGYVSRFAMQGGWKKGSVGA